MAIQTIFVDTFQFGPKRWIDQLTDQPTDITMPKAILQLYREHLEVGGVILKKDC